MTLILSELVWEYNRRIRLHMSAMPSVPLWEWSSLAGILWGDLWGILGGDSWGDPCEGSLEVPWGIPGVHPWGDPWGGSFGGIPL